ncbi:MAG: 6-phosphogluconate dehydrogenase [Parcubacteria group bacterium Gr01-1014_8]|nr:MAG: 6-phosphogluconate dehydrogenase [Parcubacteria group bacterium Gr01-1014_8]
MQKEIGMIGLGKMGGNMARQLVEKGWNVHGMDADPATTQKLGKEGIQGAYSIHELVSKLKAPRVVWLMVPAGKPEDDLLFGNDRHHDRHRKSNTLTDLRYRSRSSVKDAGLVRLLSRGDVIIDGGNSYYKDSISRAKKVATFGIKFIDVGFSGGPAGARNGGCLMIGGDESSFKRLEPLFKDLARDNGYQFFKGVGAGHFVKMVHNGIEYGMMQALGEGFAMLKKTPFKLDLTRVADIYNNGSVIESRLVGWMKKAFQEHGEDLKQVSGSVGHTGEGEWTAKTAREMKIPAKIIGESYKFRVQSKKKPSFTGKVVSALRGQFGGHNIKE